MVTPDVPPPPGDPFSRTVLSRFHSYATNRWAFRIIAALFGIAVLAPLLANEVPIRIRVSQAAYGLDAGREKRLREFLGPLEKERKSAMEAVEMAEEGASGRLAVVEEAVARAQGRFDAEIWPPEAARILTDAPVTTRWPMWQDLCHPQNEARYVDLAFNAVLVGLPIFLLGAAAWRFTKGPLPFRAWLVLTLASLVSGVSLLGWGASRTKVENFDYRRIAGHLSPERGEGAIWPLIPYSYYGAVKGHLLLPPPYLANLSKLQARQGKFRDRLRAAREEIARIRREIEGRPPGPAPVPGKAGPGLARLPRDLENAERREISLQEDLSNGEILIERRRLALEVPPHWFGADQNGRDVLARLIHGTRTALSVGLVSAALATVIGIYYGAFMGYFGGRVDFLGMRFIELMLGIPTFFLILTVIALWNPGIWGIMVVISLTSWEGTARLIRAEFLRLRKMDFVSAAEALGTKPVRIMFRHILPNGLTPVLVTVPFEVVAAILIESGLSFLGIGIKPPTASWGEIINEGRQVFPDNAWLIWAPSFAIFLTVTCYTLVGEGLRDATDPRLGKN